MRTVIIDGVEMTFHEAHQHLWNWLAEHPGKDKEDYFESHDVSIAPHNLCFACESCKGICSLCPVVKWRNLSNKYHYIFVCSLYDDHFNQYHYDLFGNWRHCMEEERFDEACEIAKEIANLEWEEVGEY